MHSFQYNRGLTTLAVVAIIGFVLAASGAGYMVYTTDGLGLGSSSDSNATQQDFFGDGPTASKATTGEASAGEAEAPQDGNLSQVTLKKGATQELPGGVSATYESAMTGGSYAIAVSSSAATCQPQSVSVSTESKSTVRCGDNTYTLQVTDNDLIAGSVTLAVGEDESGESADGGDSEADMQPQPADSTAANDSDSAAQDNDTETQAESQPTDIQQEASDEYSEYPENPASMSLDISGSYSGSLSTDQIAGGSVVKNLNGTTIDNLRFEYTEYISDQQQRVSVTSESDSCSPDEFVSEPGEAYVVTCGDTDYRFLFEDYDAEKDMVSYKVKRGAEEFRSERLRDAPVLVTPESQQTYTKCQSQSCIDDKLSRCEPATFYGSLSSAGSGINIKMRNKILGPSESGPCRVRTIYEEYHEPAYVGKSMTCDYDTDIELLPALMQAEGYARGENEARCSGSLYDYISQNE